MAITREELVHLARLARVALSEEEIDHLAPQLDEILTAVARVQEITAEGIRLTSHALALPNVLRDDVHVPSLGVEKALGQAPAVEQQQARVPRILVED